LPRRLNLTQSQNYQPCLAIFGHQRKQANNEDDNQDASRWRNR